MAHFQAPDPAFADRVRSSFDRQALMRTIGAELVQIEPGEVGIVLPFRKDLTQQHGFLHAAVVTAIVDSACGYAAMSLSPSGIAVLTVEYKVNFMIPARGDRVSARARVLRPGRSFTVCTGNVHAVSAAGERHVATMIATIASVSGRPDLAE